MDNTKALQNLLNGTATEDEINLLKGELASGEISIGGNVNNSVLVQGSENNIQIFQLTPEALELLGARPLLGDLDRDLTGDEIASGLNRLEAELPLRAPVLLTQFQEQTRRLRPSLKTTPKSLSDSARKERVEALAQVNSMCMDALDISFNALCLGEEPPEYDSRSPFRGLESFRPEDSEFFFGREALTKKLVAKIQSHPFLAVIGASGSGKSSLVMAGLIPSLGSEAKPVIFRPGTNPLEALKDVKDNVLVVVDQFEELFTLTRDETTRKEFIAKLLETSKQNKVVITLRSDFLGEVAEYRTLNEEVQNHLENVPPMDMDELRRAMEGQASQVGLRFEVDLSQQILDDVEGEPGAMPLLQHALWELWNRRYGRNLRASEYRAFGGVKQAITSTAEKAYGECTKAEQEQIRDIFLRLTRLDDSDEGRDTRRRAAMNDLIPSGQDTASITLLLDKLANARLIVKTVNEDKTEIEVAHEALIRHWERLRAWLNEDRDNLRLWAGIGDAVRLWEASQRDESLLIHRGSRLKLAVGISSAQKYQLSLTEQQYLDACEIVEKRFKLRQWILIFILLTVGVSLGWFFLRQEKAVRVQWVHIPSGSFVSGMDEAEARLASSMCLEGALDSEKAKCPKWTDLLKWSGKQINAELPEFSILDNEVTNAQYQQCVDDGPCHPPKDWSYNPKNRDQFNLPATNLNWFEAEDYCEWLGGRLPTEDEWEKAARGPDNNSYPWGNIWDETGSNLEKFGLAKVQRVVQYANSDISGYKIKNMAGNVREWTASEASPHSLNQTFMINIFIPGDNDKDSPIIVRGGAWTNERSQGMTSNRGIDGILSRRETLGFRCTCPEGRTCKSPWKFLWIWLRK